MDIKETPVISFITICYNGLADTCALIDSLQAAVHSVSYEIIVVDNASRQNEAAVISRRYPFVKTIRSKRNLGFSGGNNLGIREAGGKYIFLINNDTYITEDSFCISSATYSVCRIHRIVSCHAAQYGHRLRLPGQRSIRHGQPQPLPPRRRHAGQARSDRTGGAYARSVFPLL